MILSENDLNSRFGHVPSCVQYIVIILLITNKIHSNPNLINTPSTPFKDILVDGVQICNIFSEYYNILLL